MKTALEIAMEIRVLCDELARLEPADPLPAIPETVSRGHTHESDGMCYTSNPPKLKCKKCGAYYGYERAL